MDQDFQSYDQNSQFFITNQRSYQHEDSNILNMNFNQNQYLENPDFDQYQNDNLQIVGQSNDQPPVEAEGQYSIRPKTEGYQTKQKRVYTSQRSINKTIPITKNVPKSLGKGFKKFLLAYELQFQLYDVQEYKEFKDTENKKLRIESFNNIIQNNRLKILLEFYLENLFVIDLSHSKKIAPETYLPIIKTYLKGIKKGKIEGQISS